LCAASAKYGAPPEDKRSSPASFESHANEAQRAAHSFVCGGWDPRRDEALLFEQLLKKKRWKQSEHVLRPVMELRATVNGQNVAGHKKMRKSNSPNL